MRIDQLLPALCLMKTRSQAGRACDEGRVWLNDAAARSSKVVRSGDRIRWRDPLGRSEVEVEILEVPAGPQSRSTAREFYRELSRRTIDDPWVSG